MPRMPIRCLLPALILALYALSGFALAQPPAALRVGSEIGFPPYVDVDAQGRPTGFAVELFSAVAAAAGIDVTYHPAVWDAVWQGLQAGELDALPLVARLPEREGLVEFTQPHTLGYDSFFVRKGRPAIDTIEHARSLRIIVLRSDAAHHALIARGFAEQLVPVDDLSDGLRLLASGQHDAVLAPRLQGNWLVRNIGLGDVVNTGPLLDEYRREFAFAVRMGDTALRERLDRGLATVKASGEYDRLYKKWLGIYDTPTLPLRYTLWAGEAVVALLLILGLWMWLLRRHVASRTAELAQAERALREANTALEQRVAERTAEVVEARDLLQITMDNAPALMAYIDRECCYRRVNRSYERWFGLTNEQICGRHIREVLGEPAWQVIAPIVAKVLAGETMDIEFLMPYAGVPSRWVHATYSPDFDTAGHVRGYVVHVLDISEHKRAESALIEADRRKDEFLATLAHELRNPLAPLRNAVHILRLSTGDRAVAERVHAMMERQVDHLVRLVDDLLVVSRITRGKIELQKLPVDLATVIDNAVETSRPLIDAAGHRLTIDFPAEPLALDADPVRLTQVFANLLNNAAKYTEAGGDIRLTVRRSGDNAVVSISDTGIGIPAEDLPRVFGLFTQIGHGAGRAQGGLGIGLALVRSLVQQHGGRVEVHSAGPGEGSEFVVHLPLAAPTPAEVVPGPSPTVLPFPIRILVVDDNRDAADSLAQLLRMQGAETHVVYDGPSALDAIALFNPAVVLLDLGMPEMDGYEVARRIRQQTRFREVTLIALTGWGQEEDRRRSREAGFDHHLTKPADINALHALLTSLDPGPQGRARERYAHFAE